jgi:type IV pilus assembly protein PilA
MKKQQGFTLIELMIVVAIVAILAAIALPAYQDYIIRAQVSEAATLLDGTKTTTTEFFENKGYFPANNTSAGMASAASITGNYVASVTTATGITTAIMSASANKAVQTDALVLSAITAANGGSVKYTCKTGTPAIAARYLPTTCR